MDLIYISVINYPSFDLFASLFFTLSVVLVPIFATFSLFSV